MTVYFAFWNKRGGLRTKTIDTECLPRIGDTIEIKHWVRTLPDNEKEYWRQFIGDNYKGYKVASVTHLLNPVGFQWSVRANEE